MITVIKNKIMLFKQTSVLILPLLLLTAGLQGELSARASDSTVVESVFFRSIRANQADSYITFGQGFGNMDPLIFEAMIAPYFLLRTSRDARLGATISSPIVLRMQAKESFPVRTPSYMPGVTFYFQVSDDHPGNQMSSYLFLNIQHHSNGQFEPFFLEDGSNNTESGDFSTNFLELGLFVNRNVLPFDNTIDYFRTSLEWHPDIGRSEELKGRYSFFRWNNSFRIFRFPGQDAIWKKQVNADVPRVQTRVETTWLFGKMRDASFFDLAERFTLSITLAYRPRVLTDVSLFVNFYTGEDYYNMHFDRRINTLRFGLQAFAVK